MKLFYKYPKISMVYNDFEYINERSEIITDKFDNHFKELFILIPNRIDIWEFLIKMLEKKFNFQISYGSLFIKKSILDKEWFINPTNGNPEYFLWDFDLFLRLCSLYDTIWLKWWILRYRIHNQQITITREEEMIGYFLNVIDYFKNNHLICNKKIKKIYNLLSNS